MCTICGELKKIGQLTPPQTEYFLKKIGRAIEVNQNPEHFQLLLDKILGTEMVGRDEELEAAWERSHRTKPNE